MLRRPVTPTLALQFALSLALCVPLAVWAAPQADAPLGAPPKRSPDEMLLVYNKMSPVSWGSNDARFSGKAYQSLRFAPGSIADTAVSTSGRTFLPTRGGPSLIVDLIAHGLTCAKGYADEPLLQANASPTILLDHYTSGYTMAESFYSASHFVGWQDIIVGDPLCCPYLGTKKPK